MGTARQRAIGVGGAHLQWPLRHYRAKHFKVVLAPCSKPASAIAFILPNDMPSASLAQYAVSVQEVERRTGIRFFVSLPLHEQQRLKSATNDNQWFYF